MKRLRYLLEHWKIGLHLVLKTRRFGVNNRWWSRFDSAMGISVGQMLWNIIRIHPLVDNYKLMKIRAIQLGFLSREECVFLWGEKEVG